MQTRALVIEYDGTDFCGWQSQSGQSSIEAPITHLLRQLCHEPQLTLSCAGRTDAGVHAYGQVASFVTAHPLAPPRYATALNHFLPPTIRIHRSSAAPPGFDARFAARSKRYRYRVYSGRNPLALDRRRAWHVRRRLDVAAMRRAAAQLIGEHDFNAFRSSKCDAAHARRNMLDIRVETRARPPIGDFVDIVFHANAFCRHMCRILAGTLVEIGAAVRGQAAVDVALHSGQRGDAGVTAPPWGLTLLEVCYPPGLL